MLDYNVRDMAQSAVQANKDHQYALKVYTERLEAELETVDKLLATADISEHEDELEVNAGGIVVVPGSIKPDGLVAPGDLLNEMSPLRDDAMRRQRYVESTVIHPMKQSELDALADGVRAENHRLHALEAQLRGQQPFVGMDNHPPSHFEINKLGIDWERVAMKKVSSSGSSIVQRSAKECEIRWLGERHPQFNHTQWTQSEINRVRELLSGAKEGQVDWVDVAAKLGTRRTPIDCMRHAINRRVHIWTPEADERLLEAVRVYGVDSWTLVARLVSEDCTPTQCQSRYTRSLDPNIKRGSWTAEEDDQLRRAVAVFGHSWIEVATYVPGRNNEQCRDRYQDNLAPSVSRGKWTEDQDKALLQAIEKAGGLKWKEISRILDNGRTDNQCRARYSVLMKRRQKDDTNSPSPSSSGVPASGEQSTSGSRQSPSEPLPSNFANPNSLPDTGISTTGVEPPVARPKPKPRPRRKKAAEDASAGSTPTASGSAAAASTNTPHDAVATADTTNSVETVTEEGSSQAPRKTVRKPAKRRLSTQEGESVQLPKGKKTKTGKAPANVAHDSNSVRSCAAIFIFV
ncbi:Homeodomain-like protein [Amylocystis lapponica]|nr:Homeodomain-like protein [Amylocystis lapponica]